MINFDPGWDNLKKTIIILLFLISVLYENNYIAQYWYCRMDFDKIIYGPNYEQTYLKAFWEAVDSEKYPIPVW